MGTMITLRTGFAAQGRFYRIERQNGSLDFRILGAPWHGYITPLLAVDLDHQRHGVFNQQIAFDLRPIGLRNQPGPPQHLPALLGQMRHHGREQLNQDDRGLLRTAQSEVGRRGALLGQHLGQRIGEFADMGEADVEMQPLDAGRHLVERAMGGLAQRQRVGAERGRPGCRGGLGDLGRSRSTSRHSRCTKREAPCTRSSLQITSRSGGESDSMNQRATSAP